MYMNTQLDTIFGKIKNQISANQPCTQTFHIKFDKHDH